MGIDYVVVLLQVNIRNPWGQFEWGGAWSDNSPLWDQHPAVQAAINPTKSEHDAEFWMDYNDMIK